MTSSQSSPDVPKSEPSTPANTDVPNAVDASSQPLMFTVDTTDMILSAPDQDQILSFQKWWEEKQKQRRKGSFRLLDLPPEIRNKVFIHAFINEAPIGGHNIQDFKLPGLTRASKQLRAETLPLFFSESTFYSRIKSNFIDRGFVRRTGLRTGHSLRTIGVLDMVAVQKSIVRKAGPAALIRDITFEIISNDDGSVTYSGRTRQVTIYLHLKCVKGELRVTTREGEGHPSKWIPANIRYRAYDQGDVAAAVEAATGRAKEIGEERDFNGLTLKHLEIIARRLRYVGP